MPLRVTAMPTTICGRSSRWSFLLPRSGTPPPGPALRRRRRWGCPAWRRRRRAADGPVRLGAPAGRRRRSRSRCCWCRRTAGDLEVKQAGQGPEHLPRHLRGGLDEPVPRPVALIVTHSGPPIDIIGSLVGQPGNVGAPGQPSGGGQLAGRRDRARRPTRRASAPLAHRSGPRSVAAQQAVQAQGVPEPPARSPAAPCAPSARAGWG